MNIEPKITNEEFDNIVHLYQQLTLEQCRELFLTQKPSLTNKLKIAIKIIIASKYIYGENYKPQKNYKSKKLK